MSWRKAWYRDYAPGPAGIFHRAAHEPLVLHEIAFDMEVVVAFEPFGLQVLGHEVERRPEIHGEGAFGVASAHEYHRASAGMGTLEQRGLHAVLLLVALEEFSQLVVAYLAYESGGHAEYGSAGDGVGGRSAGHIFHAERLERGPDAVARLHVDMLHAPFGKMEGVQETVVREDGQNVGKRVAYAKYRFHKDAKLI